MKCVSFYVHRHLCNFDCKHSHRTMSHISCSICYDNILPDNALSHLACGHIFHKDCLAEWLKRSKSCPECRKRAIKPTRVFPNFATYNFDGFSGLDIQNVVERSDGKNKNIKLQIKKLSQQLTEREADFVAYKKSMTFVAESKNKLIGDLRIDIVNLEKSNKIAECNVLIEKDMSKTAVKENLLLRDELKRMKFELKNVGIDMSGRDKLIECYERVNSELENKVNDLEMENKSLRQQMDSMKVSVRCRNVSRKRRKEGVNQQVNNKKFIIDLTDDVGCITKNDDDCLMIV